MDTFCYICGFANDVSYDGYCFFIGLGDVYGRCIRNFSGTVLGVSARSCCWFYLTTGDLSCLLKIPCSFAFVGLQEILTLLSCSFVSQGLDT